MEQKEPTDPTSNVALSDDFVSLKTINNTHFTAREIDVIACIIGGRSSKKISSFLAISPNTVECHIRNIMLKLNCNSRENIIDFLEKSDKFALIKKHYSNLLIKATFELELKKIASIASHSNLGCLIFYYNKQNAKDLFIGDLAKYLHKAGFNACSKIWERGKAENFLLDKLESQPVNYIIYVITDDFLEQLEKNNHEITKEATDLVTVLKQQTNNAIFLLLNNEALVEASKKLVNFTCINSHGPKNYYLLMFELIKKLLPTTINIDKSINDFKKNQMAFLQHSQAKVWLKEDGGVVKAPINYFKGSKKLTMAVIIIALLLVNLSFIIVGINFSTKKLTSSASESTNEKIQLSTPSAQIENNASNKTAKKSIPHKLFNLPARNYRFIGRTALLQKIAEQLGEREFGVVTQAIAGLGGVGKTQLATEFAYQSAKKNMYDAVFWVAAETDIVLANSYAEFAKQLHIDVKGLKSNELQNLVHQKLSNTYSDKKVLFILDNVPNKANIQNYLSKLRKQWPINNLLHVLITTRSQYWSETPLILDVFDIDEAIAFVKKHLPHEENAAIENLVKTLNHFPLALTQAVAYIKEHTNIDDYVKLYKKQKYEFLDKTIIDDDQYKESLWKTWNISLAKLTNNARNILFISAYLEPDNIPMDFFTHLTTEKRVRAIKELRKHSFITLINRNKAFKIHRMLQEVIQLNINIADRHDYIKLFGVKILTKGANTKYKWLNKAMSLLEDKFDFDYMQCEKWHEWNNNLSHAHVIAAHAVGLSGETFKRGLQLYCKVAMFMTFISSLPDAADIWLQIKDLLEQQNNKTSKLIMAKIYYNLGAVMINNKIPDKARDYFQQTIAIMQDENESISAETWDFLSVLGIKSFYTKEAVLNYKNIFLGNTFISLGNAERGLGNFNEAIVNYNQAIAMLKKCIDNDRTKYYYMSALDQLGCTYMHIGNLIQAEQTLQKLKKELDPKYKDHVEQAYIYKHLARVKYVIGKIDEAEKLFHEVLKIEETVHSNQHLDLADLKVDLARINLVNNNILAAKVNLTAAEKIYQLYYSNDNFYSYVFLYLHFCRVYEYLGEYNKALDYITRALKIAGAYYKENLHAAMTFQITRAEQWPQLPATTNVDYWRSALAIITQLFGANHYQAARYHYLLGQALESKGNVKAAQLQYKLALKILRKQTINHPYMTKYHNEHIKLVHKKVMCSKQ